MTRRRISNRTPRELTAKERSALSDVVLELDSDFRVKTGSVANISLETPEPGVIVLNEYDGLMYYADNFGWHQAGADWSPITLFVEFNGTDQFDFKFKAPADSADPSTLIIHDGDGTITEVDGNDDTVVTHSTNYATAGTYYFTVGGDVYDITDIDIRVHLFVSGDVSGWSKLINLTELRCFNTSVYGDVSGWAALKSLTSLSCYNSNVSGDISGWSVLTLLVTVGCGGTSLSGDISEWFVLDSLDTWTANGAKLSFNKITSWEGGSLIFLFDNRFTSKMVDNALQSFVGLTGANIRLDGNNAPRTSASDAAFAIVDAANTLTVNE